MTRFIASITTAAAMVVLCASRVGAGVVLSETHTTAGPHGREAQDRTIYVQGNKQKIETSTLQVITDLDRRVVYVVNPRQREYVESPLQAMKTPTQDADLDLELHLKKTGNKRVLANHSCDEYTGYTNADDLTEIAVNACISKDAPGVGEVGGFEDRLLAELQSGKSGQSQNQRSGLVLARVAVVKMRLPDPSGKSRPTALLAERTEVNSISVKPLAVSTFAPPKDFHKITKLPPPAAVPYHVIGT
jgi:hypothetical protein